MNVLNKAELPAQQAAVEKSGAEPRVVLHAVSWQQYVAIGDILQDHPGLRMTYDRGNLEFMTTSSEHERLKKFLSRMLETLVEEFGLELATAGNMTFRREDLKRGLEPDDCFWIAHEAQMRTRREWDPSSDPPPDLVLEIEISRSALNRLSIYASLGVAEVWRCDGETIRVHVLQADGSYHPSDASPTFPSIPVAEVIAFLRTKESLGYFGLIRAFQEWVRQRRPSA